MKRLLSAVLVTVMVFALAMGTVVSAAASVQIESLDNVYVNEAQLFNGGADAWFAANEIKGKIQTIGVRGWIIMGDSQVPSSFGYRIDDGDPVKCADSVVYDEAIVTATGHSNIRRDVFTADVTKVGLGKHTFTIAAWNDADEVAYGKSFTFTQELAPDEKPEPLPPTLKAQSLDAWKYWQNGAQISPVTEFTQGTIAGFHAAGWFGYNYQAVAMGYRINGVETFVNGALRAAESAVIGIAGDYGIRYDIDGSFADLVPGDNDFDIIVKLKVDDETEIVADLFPNIPCSVIPVTCTGAAWDDLKYDDTALCSEKAYLWANDPANAEALNYTKGAVSNIYFRGWAQLSTAITAFGYVIDGGDVVSSADFIEADRAGLESVPGAKGFAFNVPVSTLEAGDHTIKVVAVDEFGNIVEVIKVKNEITYPVAISFTVVPKYTVKKASFDWYFVDGAWVTQAGGVEKIVKEDPQIYSNSAANPQIGIFGWAALEDNASIKQFGYAIDDGAGITDDVYFSRIFNAAFDRTAELTGAGYPNGEGFWIPFMHNTLSVGKHTVRLFVVDPDDNQIDILSYEFTVLEDAPAIVATCYDEQSLSGTTLTVKGWTGATYEMEELGYKVDDKDPVFDGSVVIKTIAADDPVKGAGGANAERFEATIKLNKETAGKHTVRIVAKYKDANSTVKSIHTSTADAIKVDLPRKSTSVTYSTLQYDDTVIFSKSAYKNVAKEENRSKLNFISGSVNNIIIPVKTKLNFETTGFGYVIDGGEIQGDFEFTKDAENPDLFVFDAVVPVSELAGGEHVLQIVAKYGKGKYFPLVKTSDGVDYPVGLTFTVIVPFTFDDSAFETVYTDTFGEDHDSADWYLQGSSGPFFTEGRMTLNYPRGNWVENGYAAYLATNKVDYTKPYVVEFTAAFAGTGSCYAGFGVRGADYTDENQNVSHANFNNGTRWGKGIESANGIAIDLDAPFAPGYMGIAFEDGSYGDNKSQIAVAFAPGPALGGEFNITADNKYKIVDLGDVIALFINDKVVISVELSELTDGKYTHAVVKYYDNTVLYDGVVSVNETGYCGFYQRDCGVSVDEIVFKSEPAATTCTGAAWDDLKYDDTALCSEKVYLWANDPANAEALNFETGAVSNIYFRGWAQLSTEITAFGYVIDDGDVVSSADFIEADRAGLESVPGAKGFAFNVPVSTLTAGDHKIKIVAIDAKGNPVGIIKIKNEVTYPVAISFTINDPAPAAQLIKFTADVFQLNNGILSAAGWAGANMEAANLGYRVDDGETIMDGISFTNFNTPEEGEIIKNLAGQYAFRFASRNGEIDLSGLTVGDHTVTLVLRVRDTDNKQYDVDMGSKTFTITGQPDPAILVNKSFNTVWVDGTQVCDVTDALAFLKDNPIKGEVSTIGLRGWAYIANSTIDSFGYRIDDGEPVCSASYTQDRTDLGGFGTQDVANGFNIQGIDVSDLDAGAHTVTVVVKAADGTYVDVVAVPVEITVPAPELLGCSFDWYAKNGAFVAQTGNVDQFVNEGTGIVYLHCGGDIVGFYGWAAIKNDTVSGFAYSLDGGELVSDPGFMSKTLGGDFDRGAALAQAGIPNGEGFWITYNYTDYESGKHEITFYALSSNGTPVEMFSYEFSVYSVDDFTWLYNRADNSYNTGYWMGPNVEIPTGDIEITFEAPDAFDGVYTAFFADALPGALVRIDLYDEDGALLESLNQKFVHNDDGLVEFSKAYAAGTYTVDYCYIGETGHFVLGSGTPLDIEYSVAGTCNIQFPNQAPSIALRNAEIESVEGACLNAAWDDLKYDDTALVSEKAYKWVVDNADKLDYAEGEVAAIYFRGWAQLNKAIKGFGYIIDNGDVVTDASFSEVRGDVEASFPGGVGFAILVPVDKLAAGEHTIKIVAISEDDEVVEIFKTKEDVDYPVALTFTITGGSEFALGDVNKDGSVDNKDVVVLFRELSKTNPNLDPAVADYNKDGFVDNKDVVVLFRALSSF